MTRREEKEGEKGLKAKREEKELGEKRALGKK